MKHELNKTTKHTENTSMGFDGLIGLFEHTQVTMQTHALRAVNSALVVRNWLFGWYIVEFENGGAERVEMYGRQLIKQLSIKPDCQSWQRVFSTYLGLFYCGTDFFRKPYLAIVMACHAVAWKRRRLSRQGIARKPRFI